MKRALTLAAPLFAATIALRAGSPAQEHMHGGMEHAPEAHRAIKALSQEEVDGYMAGEGMGMARPAELNGYPGPKHVLALARDLSLSRATEERVRHIYNAMHGEAVALGRSLVEHERRLDSLFVTHTIDSLTLRDETGTIAGLQARLRATHLRAHIATAALLSAEEIRAYRKLRGYDR